MENNKKNNNTKSNSKSKPQKGVCPYAKKCGGCNYQGIEYSAQLQKKREFTGKVLGQFGHIEPVMGMAGEGESPKYYRNKVHHVLGRDIKNNFVSGIYQEGTHKIVNVQECLLEDKESQEIIRTICKLAKDFKLRVYDEDTGFGLLRHVLIRKGFVTGEIMVVIVIANRMFPSKNNFIKALKAAHPQISTVVTNLNNRSDSMVLGERSEVAAGRGFIEDRLCGLKFRISPDSFYQINPVQTEKLYNTAIEYAGLTGKETVVDAYCGIGTIGLCAASKAGKVIGVELNGNAVKDARVNAKINDITNAEFYKGDAGVFMEKMAAEGKHVDVVFMDPPRAGSDKKFIDSLFVLNPDKVVYVSCNPQTQARDLKWLTAGGYKVEKIQPVDMFPYTEHVETCVLLKKINRK